MGWLQQQKTSWSKGSGSEIACTLLLTTFIHGYLKTIITRSSAPRPLVFNFGLSLFLSFYTLKASSSARPTVIREINFLQKPLSNNQKDDQRTDFATGYDFADVRDDMDEGKCSRSQGAIAMCLMKPYRN